MGRAALVLLGASVALAAGCGGDDNDDEQAIRDVIVRALTTTDVKVKCEQTASTDFVRRVYGDVTTCRRVEKPSAEDTPADDARVTAITVDGDNATARVLISGGDTPGATGGLRLEREDGDWRISDLNADLLRSQLEKGFAKPDPDLPQLSQPQVRTCMIDRIASRSDAEFVAFAYRAIREDEATVREFINALTACTSSKSGDDGDGGSVLRQAFEKGVAESLRKDGASEAAIACVNRRLRKLLTDDAIVDLIGAQTGGRDEVPAEVARTSAQALASCRS